jgi:hypothetical protein
MRPILPIVLLLAAASARAEVFTFSNSSGSGLWSNPNNWSPVGLPGGEDDVQIPAGIVSRVDLPIIVRSVFSEGTIEVRDTLNIQEHSVFAGSATIAADVEGPGNLTLLGVVRWNSGTFRGDGITFFADTSALSINTASPHRIERVLEIFGECFISDSSLTVVRPQGLLRIGDTGHVRMIGATIQSESADPGDTESFVIAGTLEASSGACSITTPFINSGRLLARTSLSMNPGPVNIGPERRLSGGIWETAAAGSMTFPVAPLGLDGDAIIRVSGTGTSPTLYGSLRQIDGSIEVDSLLPALVINSGAATRTQVTGRIKVTGDSRVSFSTGLNLAESAWLELQPSFEQPCITALNSITAAVSLGGTLQILAPSFIPDACFEAIAIVTGAGTADSVNGNFAQVLSPPFAPDQPYYYTAQKFSGPAVDAVASVNNSPADWDLNGSVDGDDTIAFFADWDANQGDINGDGGSDSDDVISYFTRFENGC